MRELVLSPHGEVSSLVLVNLDCTLIDWCQVAAMPSTMLLPEQAHDRQLEAMSQLVSNLHLPICYITETSSEHGTETLEWLQQHGFPAQRIYARGKDNDLPGSEFYLNAIDQAMDDHGLSNLIYIDDGLNLELQVRCEEEGWLHVAI